MKKKLILPLAILFGLTAFANNKDSVIQFNLPDSIKAASLLADISVSELKTKKEVFAGIKTDIVKLSLESDKNGKEIVFEYPSGAEVVAKGIGINSSEKGELSWQYSWNIDENYRLMISTAGDSAGNFSLYSGYVFLPTEKKWKLIGTCKISGQWNSLRQPAFYFTETANDPEQIKIHGAWCQRINGSWKILLQENISLPVVNLYSHIDSAEMLQTDYLAINRAIKTGRTDAKQIHEGIYYTILKEGTGRQVSVIDTVEVYYKGYLFKDESVFDETKGQPARFPLKRLITGWQIGLPLCNVGGKIRIVIPSAFAYSIRTRSAKIPPNSILIFEVEVLDSKSPH